MEAVLQHCIKKGKSLKAEDKNFDWQQKFQLETGVSNFLVRIFLNNAFESFLGAIKDWDVVKIPGPHYRSKNKNINIKHSYYQISEEPRVLGYHVRKVIIWDLAQEILTTENIIKPRQIFKITPGNEYRQGLEGLWCIKKGRYRCQVLPHHPAISLRLLYVSCKQRNRYPAKICRSQ